MDEPNAQLDAQTTYSLQTKTKMGSTNISHTKRRASLKLSPHCLSTFLLYLMLIAFPIEAL